MITPDQIAEAESRDALARIREPLPELKMDKSEAALASGPEFERE